MPAIPAIMAVSAVGGLALAAKGQSDAKKAAQQAADAAKNSGVNIGDVSRQAEDQALRNIVRSRQIEDQYAPQNRQFREGSITELMNQLKGLGDTTDVQKYIDQAAGNGSTYGGGSGQPIVAGQANSALLQDAVKRAQSDLAMGYDVPQDVRNLVARQAAATSGRVTGNLGLGRDIGLRDLGLTSLDLAQRRLTNAQALGQADLGANQFNTTMGYNAQRDNLQARQFDSQQRQQASQFDAGNNLNIAQMLQAIHNGNFNGYLQAAQFGQSLTPPVVGLDPSAIANLATGNANQQGAAYQNAAGIAGSMAQGASQLGGQAFGMGLSGLANSYNQPSYGWTSPTTYGNTSYVPPASPAGGAYMGTFGLGK